MLHPRGTEKGTPRHAPKGEKAANAAFCSETGKRVAARNRRPHRLDGNEARRLESAFDADTLSGRSIAARMRRSVLSSPSRSTSGPLRSCYPLKLAPRVFALKPGRVAVGARILNQPLKLHPQSVTLVKNQGEEDILLRCFPSLITSCVYPPSTKPSTAEFEVRTPKPSAFLAVVSFGLKQGASP